MKIGKKCLMILVVVALVSAFLCGSCRKRSDEKISKDEKFVSDSIQLCTDCGQIKGGVLCCKPDQARCPKCSLVKGSPGCCKIPKDAKTAAICTKCGQIKGSVLCCKPDQVKCPKCSLVKGSPGCCKIPGT